MFQLPVEDIASCIRLGIARVGRQDRAIVARGLIEQFIIAVLRTMSGKIEQQGVARCGLVDHLVQRVKDCGARGAFVEQGNRRGVGRRAIALNRLVEVHRVVFLHCLLKPQCVRNRAAQIFERRVGIFVGLCVNIIVDADEQSALCLRLRNGWPQHERDEQSHQRPHLPTAFTTTALGTVKSNNDGDCTFLIGAGLRPGNSKLLSESSLPPVTRLSSLSEASRHVG